MENFNIKENFTGIKVSVIISLTTFVLGCILLVLSGANGYWESMNWISYIGMILCLMSIAIYPLSWLGKWLYDKIKGK